MGGVAMNSQFCDTSAGGMKSSCSRRLWSSHYYLYVFRQLSAGIKTDETTCGRSLIIKMGGLKTFYKFLKKCSFVLRVPVLSFYYIPPYV